MSQLISTPYTTRWLKAKLISHYGDALVIANMDGRKDVIYLKESSNKLLYQFYDEERKINDDDEKERIIKLAASLIKSDIADIASNKKQYFSSFCPHRPILWLTFPQIIDLSIIRGFIKM